MRFYKTNIKKFLSAMTITCTTRPLHTRMNNDKDSYLLPLCRQDIQKGKDSKKVQAPHRLLIILCLLIVIGGLLLLLLIIIRSTSETDAKRSQLSRSERGIWVGDGWEDRHFWELKKRLILLIVDNLLVMPHNLKALLHHMHALIHAPAHDKGTPKHLQDARVGTRGGGGTATAGSAGRSGN
jgi:hypothetical protein